MHAYLLAGGTKEERLKRLQSYISRFAISAYDQIVLTAGSTSIGIADIRLFQQKIQLKPFNSPFTAGIIEDAHLLTLEAQNALLKTLEEPPAHTKIFCETPDSLALLPTIVSRCEVIMLTTKITISYEESKKTLEFLNQLTSSRPGQRLKLIDSLGTKRDEFRDFIQKALISLRFYLTSESTGQSEFPAITIPKNQALSLLRILLKSLKILDTNTNAKLAVDMAFLELTVKI